MIYYALPRHRSFSVRLRSATKAVSPERHAGHAGQYHQRDIPATGLS